jgi:hypothetical protein
LLSSFETGCKELIFQYAFRMNVTPTLKPVYEHSPTGRATAVDEGLYEVTKIHEERTSVDVSCHVVDDEVIHIKSHPCLQNTPKTPDTQTKAPYTRKLCYCLTDMKDD